MMLEASLLRFGGRGAFLNVLYVRCFAYTVSECGTKHLLLFTHHYPARCFGMNMPKSRDIQAKIPLPQAIWNEFWLCY